MNKFAKLALGVLISGGVLFALFKGVEIDKVWGEMKKADPFWVAAAVAITVYSQFVRAQRWDYFFRHIRRIPTGSLFASTMVGIAANNVLPFRLGEAVRAYSITRKERLAFTTTFTTVILERVFDMITVLAFLALTIATVKIPESAGRNVATAAKTMGGVGVAMTGLIVALFFKQDLMLRWVDKLLALLPNRAAEPLRHMFHAFIKGLEALTDRRQLAAIFAYSFWLWITFAAAFWFGIQAFHLGATYDLPGPQAALATVVLVAVFVAVPAAPGFIGNFQLGCVAALSIFGVPREAALGYSLIVHAAQFVPVTIIGGVYFVREGIRLSEVRKIEEPSPEAVEHEMEDLEKKLGT